MTMLIVFIFFPLIPDSEKKNIYIYIPNHFFGLLDFIFNVTFYMLCAMFVIRFCQRSIRSICLSVLCKVCTHNWKKKHTPRSGIKNTYLNLRQLPWAMSLLCYPISKTNWQVYNETMTPYFCWYQSRNTCNVQPEQTLVFALIQLTNWNILLTKSEI